MKKRSPKNTPAKNTQASNAPARKDGKEPPPPPEPVDVVEGVPDSAEKPSRRRLVLVLLLFAGWATFLIYCLLTARV